MKSSGAASSRFIASCSFNSGQGTIQAIVIRHDLQIDVNRARAPSEKYGGHSASKVHARVGLGGLAEGAHQSLDARGID